RAPSRRLSGEFPHDHGLYGDPVCRKGALSRPVRGYRPAGQLPELLRALPADQAARHLHDRLEVTGHMTMSIDDAIARHRDSERRRLLISAGLLAVTAISLVLDVATGPALLPVPDVAAALFGMQGTDETVSIIVWTLRLPLALMAVVAGVALGTSGAAMQTLLDNPLASPYTLGLASAAGFG